ncbi:MAG: carboxymuconolactone decarboxylase family protein, partial [Pseudomonadota bacterium]
MNDTMPIGYERVIPDVMSSMAGVHQAINEHGLDRTVHHLVQLRASQINRCAFCIKMHTREARQDGESNTRLDRVVVWDQVDDFSDKERAALAWTEALTLLEPATNLGPLR